MEVQQGKQSRGSQTGGARQGKSNRGKPGKGSQTGGNQAIIKRGQTEQTRRGVKVGNQLCELHKGNQTLGQV